jgi:hypothetical protein
MADPKDTTSFFRKVVKFVANPATEWSDLEPPSAEARETEFAKSELKAMIERKRRNDFVRKREFDMLRKVRREGLSSEQLAALGGSSKIDDSEARIDSGAKQDVGVKAKIDEIEQQMVGDGGYHGSQRRSPEFYTARTQPVPMEPTPAARQSAHAPFNAAPEGGRVVDTGVPSERGKLAAAPAAAVMSPGMSPLSPLNLDTNSADFANPFAVEVSEVAHDPELDEAVIAFANADFELCEQSLASLTSAGGSRAQHAETWLVLFDLYRAIGQHNKFETLAVDYAQQFGWSAPQWFSMPQLVAEAALAEENKPRASNAPPPKVEGQVGWVCPEVVDAETVAKLRSQTLQMPLPWVFDWGNMRLIDPEGCARMSELFRTWIGQKLDMRWLNGERLFAVLADSAPTGVRDADPAYWQLRLDALRMTNRPDAFDEAAIDYCVTYEVSPPSWEPAKCQVRISGPEHSTHSPGLSVVSEVSTSFVESQLIEEPNMVQVASVELSGQLVGDIGPTLKKLNDQLGSAAIVNVSCSKLIRVDFIAAGDLLNWVLARRTENRTVGFVDAQRLVALFFGAMGITEHAKVKVRTV